MQETPFTFKRAVLLTTPSRWPATCVPNRGTDGAPLFLINHWLTLSPPDPTVEGAVNSRAVLDKRIEQCLTERGLVPNLFCRDGCFR